MQFSFRTSLATSQMKIRTSKKCGIHGNLKGDFRWRKWRLEYWAHIASGISNYISLALLHKKKTKYSFPTEDERHMWNYSGVTDWFCRKLHYCISRWNPGSPLDQQTSHTLHCCWMEQSRGAILKKNPSMGKLHIFSDGASQFKNKFIWSFVSTIFGDIFPSLKVWLFIQMFLYHSGLVC